MVCIKGDVLNGYRRGYKEIKYIELVLDKNYCDCNELNVICGKHCDGSKNVAYAIKNILAEREEDKKRIKELEDDYIPKQIWENIESGGGKMKNITLKEMFNIIIKCILSQNTEIPCFYYKRENEFIEITEIDLLNTRFYTVDRDFSEYEWEIENSNIYINEK